MRAVLSVGVILVLGVVVFGFMASQGSLAPASPGANGAPSKTGAEPVTATATEDSVVKTAERSRSDVVEAQIHERVNQIRKKNGLHPLKRRGELDTVAEYHSKDMAESGYFSHTSPGGETISDRYNQFDVPCAYKGENIYRASSTISGSAESVAEDAVKSWMNSPSHRRNILRQVFQSQGIAVVYSAGSVYVTQNFC